MQKRRSERLDSRQLRHWREKTSGGRCLHQPPFHPPGWITMPSVALVTFRWSAMSSGLSDVIRIFERIKNSKFQVYSYFYNLRRWRRVCNELLCVQIILQMIAVILMNEIYKFYRRGARSGLPPLPMIYSSSSEYALIICVFPKKFIIALFISLPVFL